METKTVLIADDDQALATAVAIRCKGIGLETTICPDGIKAYQAILRQPPDLMILDVNMPGAGGFYLCEQLAQEPSLEPIPAIILSGKSDEATMQRCRSLGARYVWKGLDTWSELEPNVRLLLELNAPPVQTEFAGYERPADDESSADPAAARVLVVDDDPDISKAIKIRLKAYGIEVFGAYNAMQGYWAALKEDPDVIVMDYCMPEGYGSYLLDKLQRHSLTQDTPVIILTGQRFAGNKDHALERELMRLGATAFLTKPLDFEELLAQLRRHIAFPESTVSCQPPTAAVR